MCARAVPVPQIGRSGVVHRDISREEDRSSLASRVGTRVALFISVPLLRCLLILVVGWLSGISWAGAEETADTSDDVPSQAEPATRDEDSDDTADIDTESTVDTAEDKRGFKVAGDLRPIIDYFDVDVRDDSSNSDGGVGARLRFGAAESSEISTSVAAPPAAASPRTAIRNGFWRARPLGQTA